MKDLYQSQKLRWALWLSFGLAWFFMLGNRSLVPTDEGRYAEMAREMLASGDWITPRLNGIKYFEKPPLQAWMNTLSFALFGLGDWQARLWTGLSGFLGIAFTGLAAHRVFGARQGFYAALILVSAFWWAALGHINTLDMGLSGMMTISLAAMVIAQRDQADAKERRNWMLVCWAAMALAVLSKGLIGLVLPGAVLVLYTFIARDWKIWTRLHLGKGLLLFFAISAPWFILVGERNPEFYHFFFIHEHFQRFLTKIHERYGPWYYFIPLLILGIVPWLGILAQSMWSGTRPLAGASTPETFKPRLLLLIWASFIFFFFSYSSSKLPSYILPIFPALAMLVAAYLPTASRQQLHIAAAFLLVPAILALPFVAGVADMAVFPKEAAGYAYFVPWIFAACAVAIIGGILAHWFAHKTARDHFVLSIAISGFVFGQLLILGSDQIGRDRAGMKIIPVMAAHLKPEMKLYAVGLYEQCIPFYLRRTMVLVEHKDELAFGLQQQPELWIPKREDFVNVWLNGPPAMALVRPEMLRQLKQAGVPFHILTEDARRIVLLNRPLQTATPTASTTP